MHRPHACPRRSLPRCYTVASERGLVARRCEPLLLVQREPPRIRLAAGPRRRRLVVVLVFGGFPWAGARLGVDDTAEGFDCREENEPKPELHDVFAVLRELCGGHSVAQDAGDSGRHRVKKGGAATHGRGDVAVDVDEGAEPLELGPHDGGAGGGDAAHVGARRRQRRRARVRQAQPQPRLGRRRHGPPRDGGVGDEHHARLVRR
mmetsp:Transcript_7489/g.24414  ORF Transcript_7489/g.24414 Transcript_7489/m.24414 type:complete len:205 (-) Transcript_7489:73-687(-)